MINDSDAPIVVGVDGSPSSYTAQSGAVSEDDRRHRPLRLIHSVERHPHESAPAEGDDAVAVLTHNLERARAAEPDLPATTRTVDGDAAGVLVEESAQASMIVVGHRGLGGFQHLNDVLFGPFVRGEAGGVQAPLL